MAMRAMSVPPGTKPLFVLGYVAAAVYLLSGLILGFLPAHWDEAGVLDQVIWIVLSLGGCLLLLLGLMVFERTPRRGAILISLGGILGAAPLFWTVLTLLMAVALVALSVIYARRLTAAS